MQSDPTVAHSTEVSQTPASTYPRRGIWIALYGPDGAGKSAVAARLALALAPCFSGVVVRHLRISPAAKPHSAAVTQPHAQLPRSMALSCLKLIYMFVHGWLAHLLVTLPCRAAGQLIIFDRYFPDYAVDPRRYRLAHASVGFASLLGRLVPQPDLQFVLDVPAAELHRRKDEVSLAESARQRSEYAARLGARRNTMLVNADRPVDDVVREVVTEVLECGRLKAPGSAEADFAGA